MCVCVCYIIKLRTTYFTKYVYLLHSHEMWSVSCTFQIVDPSPAVESCSSEVTPSGTDHESVSSHHTKTDSLVVVSVTPERTSPSDDSSNAKGSSLCCYLLKLWARVWCLVFFDSQCRFHHHNVDKSLRDVCCFSRLKVVIIWTFSQIE